MRVNSAGQRRRVGSRAAGFTRRRENAGKKGWPDSASSSFSLPADGKKPHHLQQKQTHKQSILSFYFFVFFGSDFCSFFLLRSASLLSPLLDLFPFSFFPGRCCFLLRMAVGLLAAETRRRWLSGEETHGSKLGKQRSSSTGKGKLRLRGEDLGSVGAAG